MSLTKFTTVVGATPGATKSGGNGVFVVIGLAVLAWLGYEYVYKPMVKEKEVADAKAKAESKTDASAHT